MARFTVVAGVPEMEAEWIARAIAHLQENPFHPGLQSHEIDALSKRYGMKVFESYLENSTPSAGRIFWVYGPQRGYITVIGIEPHPQDSKRGYARVLLSALPKRSK